MDHHAGRHTYRHRDTRRPFVFARRQIRDVCSDRLIRVAEPSRRSCGTVYRQAPREMRPLIRPRHGAIITEMNRSTSIDS